MFMKINPFCRKATYIYWLQTSQNNKDIKNFFGVEQIVTVLT